jgi:anti-sigma-K factor RskA
MDALFARYFDGDLNDREAREFLEAIAVDPRLEKELREFERVLALGKALPFPKAPAGFTERVMARISLEKKRETGPERKPFRLPVFGIRWAGVAVAAAAIVLAYIGGVYTARNRPVTPATTVTDISPGFANQAAAESGQRYVRLAYVPANPSVEKVTVVGSFNNWDPETTPLQRQDGVWSTILVLAPGNYEYLFFENGARWVTDPLAVQTRDDGFGGSNAVLEVGT